MIASRAFSRLLFTGLMMAISVQSFAPTFIPAGKVSTMPFTSSTTTSLDARRIHTKKEKRKRNRDNMRAFRKRGGSTRKLVQKQLSNDQRQIENEFIAKCFMTIPQREKDVDSSFGFGGNVMGGRPGGFPTPNTKAITSTSKRQLSFRGVGETARVCKWWLDNPPEVQAERLTSPTSEKGGEGEGGAAEKVVVGKGLTVVFDLDKVPPESPQAKKRRALREAMSAKPPAAGEPVPQG